MSNKKINKTKENDLKVFLIMFVLTSVTSILLLSYFVHKKSVYVENNFNSYINKEIIPLSLHFDKDKNETVVPHLGILSKKGLSCSSYLGFDLNVNTYCTLGKGTISILSSDGNKNKYFPVFSFDKINAVVSTPFSSFNIFKVFDIKLKVDNVNFSKMILNNFLSMNYNRINELLLNDKKDIEDYENSKKELFSLFKKMSLNINILGKYINKKQFNIKYDFILKNKFVNYVNESAFAIVWLKKEEVFVEFPENNSTEIKKASFSTPSIDYLSSYDNSYLVFNKNENIRKFIYDFYKINYYGSENKIIHNQYYLNTTTDLLLGEKEVAEKSSNLFNKLYERIKFSPLAIFPKLLSVSLLDENISGIVMHKKLKLGKHPISILTDSVKLKLNYDKYIKEINDRYDLNVEYCKDFIDCKNKF